MAEISRVGVVGLGTMGSGIAQVCLQACLEVVGREVEPELGEQARARIDHYLTRGVEKERLTQADKDAALGRLTLVTELQDLAGCELVIEAAFEDLDVKRELFSSSTGSSPRTRSSRRTRPRSPSPRSRRRRGAPNGSSACTSSTRRRSCHSWK